MDKKQRYYSQHGEDFLLAYFFDFKKSGFYVDVGAFDGVHLSNTRFFEELGWSGICIEANPAYFELCRKARPRAKCINAACVGDSSSSSVDFYAEELGLLSGVQSGREEEVRVMYEKLGLEFKGFGKISVPASTLNVVLEQNLLEGTDIDIVSIDVEGSEIDVLRGFDILKYKPRVVIIESNNDELGRTVHSYMVDANGYHEARKVGVNYFYLRDSNDITKLVSMKLAYTMEKNLHPLGEAYTFKSHREDAFVSEELELRELVGKLKVDRDAVKVERNQLRAWVGKLKVDRDAVKVERNQLRAWVDKLKADKDKDKTDRDQLKAEIDKSKTEKNKLQAEIDKLKAEVSALKNSLSWKISSPLRGVGRLFKK